MTEELNWTKKVPTKSGWYWWRRDISKGGVIVWVDESGFVPQNHLVPIYSAESFGGQWYGPLQEPGGDAVENCRQAIIGRDGSMIELKDGQW